MALGRRRGRSSTAATTTLPSSSGDDGGVVGLKLKSVVESKSKNSSSQQQVRARACVRLRPLLPRELEAVASASRGESRRQEQAPGIDVSQQTRNGAGKEAVPSGAGAGEGAASSSSGQRTAEKSGGDPHPHHRRALSEKPATCATHHDSNGDDGGGGDGDDAEGGRSQQPSTPSTVGTFAEDEQQQHGLRLSSPPRHDHARKGCVSSLLHLHLHPHQPELDNDDRRGPARAPSKRIVDDGGTPPPGDRRKPSLLKRVVGKASKKVKAARHGPPSGDERDKAGAQTVGAESRADAPPGGATTTESAADKGIQAAAPAAQSSSWEVDPDGRTLLCPASSLYLQHKPCPQSYSFDAAYGPSTKTAQLYSEHIRPAARSIIEGTDGLVLLHGPAGGGRTHTLIGTEADPGIVPLAVLDLFAGFREEEARAKETAAAVEDGPLRQAKPGVDDEEKEKGPSSHRRSTMLGWRKKGKRRPRQSPQHGQTYGPTEAQSDPLVQPQPRRQRRRERQSHSLRVSLIEITDGRVRDRLCPASGQELETAVNHVPGTGLAPPPERVGTAASLAAVRRCPNEIECGTADEAFGALARGRARLGSGSGGAPGHVVVRMIVTCRIETLEEASSEVGGEEQVTAVTSRTAALTLVDPLPSDSPDADDSLAALEAAIESAAGSSDLWNAAVADNDATSAVHSTCSGGTDHTLARMLRPLLGGNANLATVCALPPLPPTNSSDRSPSPTATSLELESSLKALQLTERFTSIVTRPRPNDLVAEDTPEVRRYKEEIAALKAQLVETKTKAERDDAAAERREAEEELKRSRAEVERLRFELAGAGTVMTGSGRRLAANTSYGHLGGGSGRSEVLRGAAAAHAHDSNEALREQRLRDVEKHVDNAIRRIVAAHGIRFPASLSRGPAGGRGWGSSRGGGGAWDSERSSPSRGFVGRSDSAGGIIREESQEDLSSREKSGGSGGGGSHRSARIERDCASSRRTANDADDETMSASDWNAVGDTGHLLHDSGCASSSVFTDSMTASSRLLTDASLSQASGSSRYLPSSQLRSLAASSSGQAHRSSSLHGTSVASFGTRPLSPAESVRESLGADELSAAGGSLAARLLGEGGFTSADVHDDEDVAIAADPCWEEDDDDIEEEEEGRHHDSGTFATARQGSFAAFKSSRGSAPPPPVPPLGLDSDGRVASPDTFVTAMSPSAAVTSAHNQGRKESRRSPSSSPQKSFHSDFDRAFNEMLFSQGVGTEDDDNADGVQGSERDLWRGLNENDQRDYAVRHARHQDDVDGDAIAGDCVEDDDDDVLSVVSSAVSSLTSATTLFGGHRDGGAGAGNAERHRDPAVVVGELWRIQSLLRTALREATTTTGSSPPGGGGSGGLDGNGMTGSGRKVGAEQQQRGSVGPDVGPQRFEGGEIGETEQSPQKRGSAHDRWA